MTLSTVGVGRDSRLWLLGWLFFTQLPLGFMGRALGAICEPVVLRPSSDFSFLIASGGPKEKSPAVRWYQNGTLYKQGRTTQRFLLGGDASMRDAWGAAPVEASAVELLPGRWGPSFRVLSGGRLTYATDGVLPLQEGAIEIWIALHQNGNHAVYASRNHVLFRYRAANGDELTIQQSSNGGVLYGGGNVRGQWQSAYGSAASMSGWAAGEWHHLLFSWSATGNFMRFYIDGIQTADTNERHYWPPEASSTTFSLGTEEYQIDEFMIHDVPLPLEEIRGHAARLEPTSANEAWLSLAGVSPGTVLAVEYDGCPRQEYPYRGLPLLEIDPPSTLLPSGTDSLRIRFRTRDPAVCTGVLGPMGTLPGFPATGKTLSHEIWVNGLNANPDVVNEILLRCDSEPAYLERLRYRCLPQVNPRFPRTGNLWGTSQIMKYGLEYAARIDLHLGASFTASQIRQLRQLNPQVLVLTSINTVENSGVPEDFYLKDVQGKRIEVWPGTYRLNLTRPEVAEYQARYAYQRILDSNLMVDGCFFDNFFTSQSWLKKDMWGRAVQLDANGDGKEDDPQWLDRTWKEGVYAELREWRKLMPHALAGGHLPRPPTEEFSEIFNGDSIGFLTADVMEGKQPFGRLWQAYFDWWKLRRLPIITMVESSPPDDIAYGYSYTPNREVPPETLEFARTYYPNVRFGLVFTLLGDGFFAHEYGDTWHGNAWWYDELDFDLGFPKGEADRVELGAIPSANQIRNGGFENPLEGTWLLTVSSTSGTAATVIRDATTFAEGRYSARVEIGNAGQGVNWHIDFNQRDQSLLAGTDYDLSFWCKASAVHPVSLSSQKGSPDWRNYGLSATLQIGTAWKQYQVSFRSNATVNDSRMQFFLGSQTGMVWIDDVRLVRHPPDVWQREFDNGRVLLNATPETVTIPLGPGYRRLAGTQAPRLEFVVDNDSPWFSAGSSWKSITLDSGEWTAVGPFYHDWGKDCRRNEGTEGAARWELPIVAADRYTLQVWWPAAPGNGAISRDVSYEVVAAGAVIAAKSLDQSQGGDRWQDLAVVTLSPEDKAYVRLTNRGSGSAIADALYVRSDARYNDGTAAWSVTLQPYDGIILQRDPTASPRGRRR